MVMPILLDRCLPCCWIERRGKGKLVSITKGGVFILDDEQRAMIQQKHHQRGPLSFGYGH